MPTPQYYFDQPALEARLSEKTVADIYDDDNDGAADSNPVTGLQRDATSLVNGYLRGIYQLPFADPVPNEVTRLALDVGVALAAQRHPEIVRRDWKMLLDQARSELEDLRTGKTRLDVVGMPEPAANEGGVVLDPNPDDPTGTSVQRKWDEMGDF